MDAPEDVSWWLDSDPTKRPIAMVMLSWECKTTCLIGWFGVGRHEDHVMMLLNGWLSGFLLGYWLLVLGWRSLSPVRLGRSPQNHDPQIIFCCDANGWATKWMGMMAFIVLSFAANVRGLILVGSWTIIQDEGWWISLWYTTSVNGGGWCYW